MDILNEFFATPSGQTVMLVAILAAVDLGIGVMAAVRDNVFQFDSVAAWLRKTLVGRVMPIFGFLLVGHAVGGMSIADGVGGILSPGFLISGVGLLAAVTYITEVVASIRESTQAKPDTRVVPTD